MLLHPPSLTLRRGSPRIRACRAEAAEQRGLEATPGYALFAQDCDLACPTGAKAPFERKGQFSELSNQRRLPDFPIRAARHRGIGAFCAPWSRFCPLRGRPSGPAATACPASFLHRWRASRRREGGRPGRTPAENTKKAPVHWFFTGKGSFVMPQATRPTARPRAREPAASRRWRRR
jgi:hypothetical protein